MKYITYETHMTVDILIFPLHLTHADVFKMMVGNKNISPIGAGFVDLQTMRCYGESVSLDLASTEACTNILRSNGKTREWTPENKERLA